MPKISIIIPFNNIEQYIEQCLTSVCSKTLKDIEVICVNDASTDGSRKIVEEFINKDSRIKLIDLDTRKGQGYARNRAIEIAQGEYIGFVDSDDWVDTDMFLELYNKAKENDNDITICQAREYDDINNKYILSDYYSLTILEKMGERVFSSVETKDELLDINVVLWNKIYKKEYLDKIGQKFPEGFIYEDLPFFFGTYLPANKIQIVWKNFYIYRVNRKNSTMQQFNKKILDRLAMVSLTYEKMKKFDFLNDIQDKIKGWIINDLFHRYTMLKESYQKEYFFEMKKIFKSLDIQDLENPYWKSIYHFQGYLMVLNNSFEDFNRKVFNEYLDIHEIENRLRTEMCSIIDVDNKVSNIYDDLNKNYEYTNELNKNINEKLNQNKEEIQGLINSSGKNITIQTDGKISKVYEEITKNYEYTNKLNEEQKVQIKNFESLIRTDLNNFSNTVDKKITKVYEEITKNYEYTNAGLENVKLYADKLINDKEQNLYGIINSKYSGLKTEIDRSQLYLDINKKIKEIYDKNSESYKEINYLFDNMKQLSEEKIKNLKEEFYNTLKEENVKKEEYLISVLEQNKLNFENKIEEETNKIKDDYSKRSIEIQELLIKQMNVQNAEKEQQIKILQDRINYLSKSPIRRIIDKINKKKKK